MSPVLELTRPDVPPTVIKVEALPSPKVAFEDTGFLNSPDPPEILKN
jgi:hypothetical protein